MLSSLALKTEISLQKFGCFNTGVLTNYKYLLMLYFTKFSIRRFFVCFKERKSFEKSWGKAERKTNNLFILKYRSFVLKTFCFAFAVKFD